MQTSSPTSAANEPGREPSSAEVLDRFLANAAAQGERLVAWTRLALAGIALGRILFLFDGFARLAAGQPKAWTAVGAYIAAAAWSFFSLAPARSARGLSTRLYVSVLIDAAVLTAALASVVLWPRAGYVGILRSPDTAILLLAAVAAGLRMRRGVALVGGAAAVIGQGALMVVDVLRHGGGGLAYGLVEGSIWSVLMAAAVALGLALAARTERLVVQGANAAVSAERARQRLGVYVSEQIARELLDRPEGDAGGRRQQVAILFADLRGFTRYAEELPAEQLVFELNAWLAAMVRAARAHDGVVDKFIGDAVMVVFGIPQSRPDSATRALRVAAEMQRGLEALNRERERQGRPPFRHGIGVHYGEVVAGPIGDPERLQYTVVGNAVNLASRLESATKQIGAPVLLSSAVVEAAAAESGEAALPPLRSVGPVTIPGRAEPVAGFTLAEPTNRGSAASRGERERFSA